jgi:hypothetical protein
MLARLACSFVPLLLAMFATMIRSIFGVKIRLVSGYPGGNEINLAMERGEVQARNNTWSSWKATKPDWLRDKKVSIIVQAGPRAPMCILK